MIESMDIRVVEDRVQMGAQAGALAAQILKGAIESRGQARLVAATGTSQFELLSALCRDRSVDWPSVELFHLDEYLGIPSNHPASFRRFLRERLVEPAGIGTVHWLDGTADPRMVMAEVGIALRRAPIDLACVGVGENGHLAFNEPPADFSTTEPLMVVELQEISRRQQVGEGWFRNLEDVPARAMTMTIPEILRAARIVCVVPDARKARAVRACFGAGRITPDAPASALLGHPGCVVYLDRASATGLESTGREDVGQPS